jgi:hypothetical protein
MGGKEKVSQANIVVAHNKSMEARNDKRMD